jgi:hypothetical protein
MDALQWGQEGPRTLWGLRSYAAASRMVNNQTRMPPKSANLCASLFLVRVVHVDRCVYTWV